MGGWTNELIGGWIYVCVYDWVAGWMGRWVPVYKWVDGWVDVCMYD